MCAKCFDSVRVLHRWFLRYGYPVQLVSDDGPQFISHEFDWFFLQMNGVEHIKSSAYHSCSNGGAERFVRTVKWALRACYIEKGDHDQKANNFLFGYRSTFSVLSVM